MQLFKRLTGKSGPIILAGALIATGFAHAADKPPIRIGVLAELTGPFTTTGTYLQRTVEAYAKAVNAKGGIEGHPVELVVIDNQSKPELAVAGVRKLASDEKVHVVICCSASPLSIAVKPVSKQMRVPVIAQGQAADVIQPPDQAQWIFRPNVSQEAALRVQLDAVKKAGYKNIAYLGVNNAFGTFPGKLFETLAPQYGVKVSGTQYFEVTSTDVKAQLSQLIATRPDAIFVWAVGPAATLVSRNAQELAMRIPIYHSGGAANGDFIRDGGAAVEGNFVSATVAMAPIQTMSPSSPSFKVAKEYNDAWLSSFKTTGDEFGRTMWDAMNLISLAVKAKQPNFEKLEDARSAIRDGLEGVSNYEGLAGTFNMTAQDHSGLARSRRRRHAPGQKRQVRARQLGAQGALMSAPVASDCATAR